MRRYYYPHMPISKVLIYRLLFLCVCVCVCVFRLFVRLPISPPRIKLAASNFARRFISVQGGESPIFVNFAPTEAQNRTNRLARGPHTPLQYVAQSRIGIIDIGQSTLTFLLCLTFKMKKKRSVCARMTRYWFTWTIRSSPIAKRPRDALYQSKSCKLLHELRKFLFEKAIGECVCGSHKVIGTGAIRFTLYLFLSVVWSSNVYILHHYRGIDTLEMYLTKCDL